MASPELAMLIAFGDLARQAMDRGGPSQMSVPMKVVGPAMSEVESLLSKIRQLCDIVDQIPEGNDLAQSIKDKLVEVLDAQA